MTDVPDGQILTGGVLSAEELHLLSTHLYQKLGNRNCEMCGTNSWQINNYLVSPVFLNLERDGDRTTGTSVSLAVIHPSIHLYCQNCGNTKLMSLRALGFDGIKGREDWK